MTIFLGGTLGLLVPSGDFLLLLSMSRITRDLLRRKAEHHDGILPDLEELSLHQLELVKIEVVGDVCRHLKILYLQVSRAGTCGSSKPVVAAGTASPFLPRTTSSLGLRTFAT